MSPEIQTKDNRIKFKKCYVAVTPAYGPFTVTMPAKNRRKAWSHSEPSTSMLKGVLTILQNKCHPKSQAPKEIIVYNGMKKHKDTTCKQIFPFGGFKSKLAMLKRL